jgi:hypothetical protein
MPIPVLVAKLGNLDVGQSVQLKFIIDAPEGAKVTNKATVSTDMDLRWTRSNSAKYKFYWLLLGVLTTWRLTHLLQAEDGPWDVVVRLRRRAGEGFWGKLLDCSYCLSVWIAAPVAYLVGEGWAERLFLWPSLSAGAIFLEEAIHPRRGVTPANYVEDAEQNDAVLRKTEGTVVSDGADSSQA